MFNYMYFQNPKLLFWLLPLTIWDLFWRGKALWRASKNNSPYWFVALLIVNSIGILPLAYLAFFSKKVKNKK